MPGRVLSVGRFCLAENAAGDVDVYWEVLAAGDYQGQNTPDGFHEAMPDWVRLPSADRFRLPRTVMTLIRKAAAGEQLSPGLLLRVMRGG